MVAGIWETKFLKDGKYIDVSAKFPPIPRFEIWLFTVQGQRAKTYSDLELITVSLGWGDKNCHWGLTNKVWLYGSRHRGKGTREKQVQHFE